MPLWLRAARLASLFLVLLSVSVGAFAQTAADLIDQASIAIDEERLNEAIRTLNEASQIAETDSDRANIYSLYGYVFYLSGDYESSVENYLKALAIIEPLEGELEYKHDLYSALQYAMRQVGREDEAERYTMLMEEAEAAILESQGEIWKTDPETGDLIYTLANIRFPETVGLFVRADQRLYDDQGYDVSIGYRISGVTYKAVMTVYSSYYPDSTFDSFIQFSKRDLLARYPGVVTLIDERKSVYFDEEGDEVGSYGLRLKINDPEQNDNWSDEELWIASQGKWFVKLRVTKKDAYDEEVNPSFQQFLDQVDIGLNDQFVAVLAGQREGLDFCGTEANLSGEGGAPETPVTADELMALTLPGLGAIGSEPVPASFCIVRAERYETGYKLAFLYNADEPDALAATSPLYAFRLFDPNWQSLGDIVVGKLGDEFSDLGTATDSPGRARDIYVLTVRDSDSFTIYNYYRGRPSMQTAYDDAVTVINGEKSFMVKTLIDEAGNTKVNLNADLLALEDEAGEN